VQLRQFKWSCPVIALAVVAASCGLSEDRAEAERLADHYFDVVAGPDTAATLSLYSPQFFEASPRDEWANTLRQLRIRCGPPISHTLKSWAVNNRAGTNAGSNVTLVYDVAYAQCHMSETISTFRPDGGERKIIGHLFKPDDSLPNPIEKATTTT
jgi:hypothetical protein